MKKTVKEVSRLCGVSVRTLHYYDEIGVLCPEEKSEAGYRLYGEGDLARLRQILFFRELDFPLREIQQLLDHPSFDEREAMRRQRELLILKRDRLNRLLDFLDQIEKGGRNMKLDAFDTSEIEEATRQFAEEAEQRWGHTEAWQAFQKREPEEGDAEEERERIFHEIARCRFTCEPASAKVQELVAQWQGYLHVHCYPCDNVLLAQLGMLYSADARFAEYYDAHYGAGTAQFFSEAIRAFCQ